MYIRCLTLLVICKCPPRYAACATRYLVVHEVIPFEDNYRIQRDAVLRYTLNNRYPALASRLSLVTCPSIAFIVYNASALHRSNRKTRFIHVVYIVWFKILLL
jgi:hypothetical protein